MTLRSAHFNTKELENMYNKVTFLAELRHIVICFLAQNSIHGEKKVLKMGELGI
jgi:hypothetical protein